MGSADMALMCERQASKRALLHVGVMKVKMKEYIWKMTCTCASWLAACVCVHGRSCTSKHGVIS